MVERKQDVLDDLTDILGLPRWVIKRPGIEDGSSIPSHMFAAAAMQVGVASGRMPETNERIIRKAGLPFDNSYDSRHTESGGGDTVTLAGLQALREALTKLIGPARVKAGRLLTWRPHWAQHPDPWAWPSEEVATAIDGTAAGQVVQSRWSIGPVTSHVHVGDRAFLVLQGSSDYGIVASATIRSQVYQDVDPSDSTRLVNYADVEWEAILAPDEALPVESLYTGVSIDSNVWHMDAGTVLAGAALQQLETLWLDHLRKRAKKGSGTMSGQARLQDAERRKAIEDAAQNWLMKVYEDAGWVVEDTHIGNPFDARATKDGQVLYLEAKGTQSAGASVIVTRNEIAHAKANPGNCVIGVWSGIRFGANGKVDPKGGAKVILDWQPVPADLNAISHDGTVNGQAVTP